MIVYILKGYGENKKENTLGEQFWIQNDEDGNWNSCHPFSQEQSKQFPN